MNRLLWVLTGNGGPGLLVLLSASASTAHIRSASANVIRKVAATAPEAYKDRGCIYTKCGILDCLNNKQEFLVWLSVLLSDIWCGKIMSKFSLWTLQLSA